MSSGGARHNSGPRPRPTVVHLASGNKKEERKRQSRGSEANVTRGVPTKPDSLSDAASAIWDDFAKRLDDAEILTTMDGFALERMCECYASILQCDEDIQRHGYTYMAHTQHGSMLKANPAVVQRKGFEALFKSYLVEFGLTPSARARVRAVQGEGGEGGDGKPDVLD